jgi:galactose mutarotase-like enzyme
VYQLDTEMVRSQHPSLVWPFACRLQISFTIAENGLIIEAEVHNLASEIIYFQFGWHPGFRTPATMPNQFFSLSDKQACSIHLPLGKIRRYQTNRASELTGEYLDQECSGQFLFDESGLDYTYVLDLTNMQERSVCLRDPIAGIEHWIELGTLPHLGIWSDPGAPFICLEPWNGCDDWAQKSHFEDRFGTLQLLPGKSWTSKLVYRLVPIGNLQ